MIRFALATIFFSRETGGDLRAERWTFLRQSRRVALRFLKNSLMNAPYKAVPAQRERTGGAGSATELALAGTIEVRIADGMSYDALAVWPSTPSVNARDYTLLNKTVNSFL